MTINPQNSLISQTTPTQLGQKQIQPDILASLQQTNRLASDQLNPMPKTEKDAFTQFVGETFYSIMVKQMRAGTGEKSLFGDSSATQMYQQQFDTMIVQKLAANDSSNLSNAMYELHKLGRAN